MKSFYERNPVDPVLELNGVANAILLLDEGKIVEAKEELILFCKYARAYQCRPMAWHEFKRLDFNCRASALRKFFQAMQKIFDRPMALSKP